ncbi:I78 family peptidase inhibitor [Wenxinia saemankumensis]|uniref:Peptidase inhibitor I78 family protein n=1 Tax=Wenxinia saemankumensis TaxID=1447782 RepID=A0A1M6DZE9_9RHOB|nr:I78 family peptidase inhibitor [Wenxinia saemankumensis]SHI78561.1 Peptidase inhibitor I78 family protein [Wenxinia saemankumensis]
MTRTLFPLPLIALLAACEMPADPAAPDADPGTCGADGYQSLIGSNIAAVTLPADLDDRILYPDSMATMDYRPDRINFYVSEGGIIQRVACG